MKKIISSILLGILLGFTLLFIVSRFRQPSNDRNWESGFSPLAEVEISEDKKTFEMNEIRNWRYDENGPISFDYSGETYYIDDIERFWFMISQFGLPFVAHTYITVDFENKEPLALSIEARREKDEEYGIVKGLFNTFEIMYMWGDEDDFTTSRAVVYGKDIRMYPLKMQDENKKAFFLKLMEETDKLETQPRFYNSLTSNCTNSLFQHANDVRKGSVPPTLASLMPGISDRMLLRMGYIDNVEEDITIKELREKFTVGDFIRENYQSETFNEDLRNHLLN